MGEGAPRPDFSGSKESTLDSRLRSDLKGVGFDLFREGKESAVIGEKILSIVRAKEMIDDMMSFRDDISVYQRYKMLGIFLLEDGVATADYEDSSTGFSIKRGDRYLGLHLTPVKDENKSFAKLGDSLSLVAQYIQAQGLSEVPSMMGITFEKLAIVSRRIGFSVSEPQIDARTKQRVQEVFDAHYGTTGRDLGRFMLVQQPTTAFLERYLPQVKAN